MKYSNYYLAHYGVKGMKWGVRRYQNEDGTLTDAGKERYYNNEDRKNMYEQSRKSVRAEDRFTGRHLIDGIDDISEAGGFLKKQSEVINDNFNEYLNSCRKDLAGLKDNQAFMAAAKKRMTEDIGAPGEETDPEVIVSYAMDAVYDNFYAHLSKKTKDAQKRFSDSVDQYRSNVDSIVKDIVGEYGDQPVASFVKTSTSGTWPFRRTTKTKSDITYKSAVENTILKLGDSSWVRYLYNHSEMAWADYDGMIEIEKAVMKDWMDKAK